MKKNKMSLWVCARIKGQKSKIDRIFGVEEFESTVSRCKFFRFIFFRPRKTFTKTMVCYKVSPKVFGIEESESIGDFLKFFSLNFSVRKQFFIEGTLGSKKNSVVE